MPFWMSVADRYW